MRLSLTAFLFKENRKYHAIIVSSKINVVQLNTHINKINDNENKVKYQTFHSQTFQVDVAFYKCIQF